MIDVNRDHMPDQYRLGFALWTHRLIAQLIKQFWGIEIPTRILGDYLKRRASGPRNR
ncbi:hypothetical protein [Marinobacterium aestuariivivens]|uniref:Transposase n=1 Tax=Marinobacterium aestuariivivens TaxID=1698799 RepID=A0ABW2A5E6_9GAMM